MSSHRFGPMETGRDMSAEVLLWPPTSLYDASLEPMVCRHAHNLPATEEWRSSSRLGNSGVANKRKVAGYTHSLAATIPVHRSLYWPKTTADEREKSVATISSHSFLFWAHRGISTPRRKDIVSSTVAVGGHLPAFPFLCRFPGTP